MGVSDRHDAAPAAVATPPPAPERNQQPSGERIGGLVLAAGAARRFGSAKQLAPLHGRPLLEHALLAMAAATRVQHAAVVLGFDADQILAGVERHGADAVICASWEDGQAASLRAGIEALAPSCDAIVITLGDQPAIDPRAIDRVVEARGAGSDAVRATYAGRPGHPVLIERRLFDRVAALSGDEGARNLLSAAAVALIDCDGLGDDGDIDTAEQLRISAGG